MLENSRRDAPRIADERNIVASSPGQALLGAAKVDVLERRRELDDQFTEATNTVAAAERAFAAADAAHRDAIRLAHAEIREVLTSRLQALSGELCEALDDVDRCLAELEQIRKYNAVPCPEVFPYLPISTEAMCATLVRAGLVKR